MPGPTAYYCDSKNILTIFQNGAHWESALGQLKLT